MKAVELFAGVGGFRLGLERAGHRVIWANEWDKFAAQTYDKNFGGYIDRRDITQIPAEEIPAHDLICGGFPCQAFSVAGRRRGFGETRGTLFFEIVRIAAHHKTKYLLLENVKNLIHHDGGRTFTTILRALDELGYDCQWQVLNSKDFGVPQNRERVIIVGHLRGQPRPQIFPLGASGGLAVPARGEARPEAAFSGALSATSRTGRPRVSELHIVQRPRGKNAGGTHEIAPALTGKSYQDNNHVVAIAMRGRDGVNTPEPRADGLANALRASGGGSDKGFVADKEHIRRLTPLECERLQGFPDGWTAGVSDAQRYKQMGNAVTVNVIEAVARRLQI
jgi:DNA (cytosine-5)-methyltransferase 1